MSLIAITPMLMLPPFFADYFFARFSPLPFDADVAADIITLRYYAVISIFFI